MNIKRRSLGTLTTNAGKPSCLRGRSASLPPLGEAGGPAVSFWFPSRGKPSAPYGGRPVTAAPSARSSGTQVWWCLALPLAQLYLIVGDLRGALLQSLRPIGVIPSEDRCLQPIIVQQQPLIRLLFRQLHRYFLQDKMLVQVNHPVYQKESYQIHELFLLDLHIFLEIL